MRDRSEFRGLTLRLAIAMLGLAPGVVFGGDFGESMETARPLTLGDGPMPGALADASDRRVYRIDLPSPGRLQVRSIGGVDTRGTLRDSGGALLAEDDNRGDGSNFRIAAQLQPGTYYVDVAGTDAGQYSLQGWVGELADHGDTAASASLLRLHPRESIPPPPTSMSFASTFRPMPPKLPSSAFGRRTSGRVCSTAT